MERLLCVCLLLSAFTFVALKSCEPLDTCSCKLDSDEVISLWPIDDPSKPMFQNVSAAATFTTTTYDYSPCTPFQKSSQWRSQYALLFKNVLGSSSISGLGKTTLATDYNQGQLQFIYHGWSNERVTITLICDEHAETATMSKPVHTTQIIQSSNYIFSSIPNAIRCFIFPNIPTSAVDYYSFTLTSKHVCPTKRIASSPALTSPPPASPTSTSSPPAHPGLMESEQLLIMFGFASVFLLVCCIVIAYVVVKYYRKSGGSKDGRRVQEKFFHGSPREVMLEECLQEFEDIEVEDIRCDKKAML